MINLTKTEKSVLVSLLIFLAIGICIRAILHHNSPVAYTVTQSFLPKKAGNSSARLKTNLLPLYLDLNLCGIEQLEKLKEIGPKLARTIIEYRTRAGEFKNTEELLNVKGFGKRRYEKLRRQLLVAGQAGQPLDFQAKGHRKEIVSLNPNSAKAEELDSLPGIGKKVAEEIVRHRGANGPFLEKTDLLKVKGVSIPLYLKVSPYLKVE